MPQDEPSLRDREMISAIVMPHENHCDEQVTETLVKTGAQVHRLAKGFLSVKATRQALREISPVARVEEKTLKQMH